MPKGSEHPWTRSGRLREGAAGLTWRRYRTAAGGPETVSIRSRRSQGTVTMNPMDEPGIAPDGDHQYQSTAEAIRDEPNDLLPPSAMTKRFAPVKDWVRRTPGPDELQRGKVVAQQLESLRAKDVLIRAALAGYVSELRCRMTHCFCPLGENRFQPRTGAELGPWIPTDEHYPKAARDRGTYRLDNVVLAHRRCNNVGHKLEALYEHLTKLGLDPRAIEIAIEDQVAERRTRDGRYPRSRGSWKRAREIAQKSHDDLQAKSEG